MCRESQSYCRPCGSGGVSGGHGLQRALLTATEWTSTCFLSWPCWRTCLGSPPVLQSYTNAHPRSPPAMTILLFSPNTACLGRPETVSAGYVASRIPEPILWQLNPNTLSTSTYFLLRSTVAVALSSDQLGAARVQDEDTHMKSQSRTTCPTTPSAGWMRSLITTLAKAVDLTVNTHTAASCMLYA